MECEVLYLSSVCSERFQDWLYNKTAKNPGFAVQKFNRLVVSGLISNNVDLNVLSSLPVSRSVSKRLFWRRKREIEKDITYNYVPSFNIPVLRQIGMLIYAFFYVLFWGRKERRRKIIVADVLSFSLCKGALLASKILNIKSIGIVTDMPGLMVNAAGVKKNLASRLPGINKWVKSSIYSYDGYVFLTEQMNTVINRRHVPYIVMEGLTDSTIVQDFNNYKKREKERILIYAGGLHERYGLKTIVQAISNIEDKCLRFWLFGSGPFVKELENKYTIQDPRIIYKGIVPNEEVVRAEKEAILLINPRPTHEEFTKYSFPSKNMEYMVSGTPVLTTNLPGMPGEYKDYVFVFDEESVEGYRRKLEEVLSLPDEVLLEKGRKAKEWVLSKKNNKIQTARILELASCIMNS